MNIGKKFYEILGKFKHHKTEHATLEALKKITSIERSKILENVKPVVLAKNLASPELPKTNKNKSVTDKEISKENKEVANKIKKDLVVGCKIKLKNQKSEGILLDMEGRKLTVQLGNFIVKTSLSEVEV